MAMLAILSDSIVLSKKILRLIKVRIKRGRKMVPMVRVGYL